jgi:diguanylate cyclase (GGDEF)-like protein
MLFDVRTLLVAVALANVFCAAARFLLWRMHPAIPGLGRWALAGAAGALALFMIFFYGIKHWPLSLSLAQLFVLMGMILAWNGFRLFIGRPLVSRLTLTVFGTIVLTWITMVSFQHSLEFRALGNAMLIVILSALIAYELLSSPRPIPPAMYVMGWVYALNAMVFLIRIVAADQNAVQAAPLNPDGFAPFILLWWLCMTIAVTLGMMLMTGERLQVALDKQANHDPLTGALNRRAFSLMAEKMMSQSRRYDKPLAILMMDLDRFKQINDLLGHHRGDELLCRFVAIAGQVLRGEDIFCRFGGEEFVALLPNTCAEMALVAAERLRTAFAVESSGTANKELSFTITVSIGVAELEQEEDIEALLHRADIALYQAKGRGRNCCELAQGVHEDTSNGYLGYLEAD